MGKGEIGRVRITGDRYHLNQGKTNYLSLKTLTHDKLVKDKGSSQKAKF